MPKDISGTSVPIPSDPLLELADKWEKAARRKMDSARLSIDSTAQRPTGEALIQHGAICYFNCAQELRKALVSVS